MSPLPKIFIASAMIVVIAGGALVWWLFFQPTSQTPGQTQNQSGTQPFTDNGTGQTTPTATPSSIAKAYARLFQKLGAQNVSFSTVSAVGGDTGNLYGFYKQDVDQSKKLFPKLTDVSIQIGLVDLNGDASVEALVMDTLPIACGTAGCSFDIYQKQNGSWSLLYSSLAQGQVGVASTVTNGYHDLFLTMQGNGYQTNVVRFQWDGKTYVAAGTVATWDGSVFITK
jgi:hypothetical protein